MLRRPFLGLLLLALVAASAPAQDDALAPEALDRLEGQFHAVAEKTRPASVAILGLVGMGSGVVIDRTGLVLTNAHVAVAARFCAVVFPDGTKVVGRRIGIYFPRDLALIQLPEGTYPAVEMAPADSVSKGDWVVAYGHPGGLKPDHLPTFSAGRVTGTTGGVAVGGLLDYSGGVQTDLAIYSGNSGGPLFDLEGRLVGINGAVNPAVGESYSLSVDILEAVLPKLRESKIWLSDDLAIDPTDARLASFFEAYDEFSKQVANNWIETGWPGEKMPVAEAPENPLEAWAGRLLDRIDAARGRVEDLPIWKGRHSEARQALLGRSFSGRLEAGTRLAVGLLDREHRPVCLGTVVGDGYVVTKASLVGNRDQVEVAAGSGHIVATLVSASEEHDLALYRAVGVEGGRSSDGAAIPVGSWVLVPGSEGDGLGVGVLSATARPIPAASELLVGEAVQRGIQWTLARILRASGMGELAEQLERNDRQQRIFELKNTPRTYPTVVQHDAPLDIDRMGGPVLDARGRLLGVNVHRAHHGTVYAVPIDLVRRTFAQELEED